MTLEEKAKAYDEALKWMRELYPRFPGTFKEKIEHYFPELRESEDERIRKELIFFLKEEIPQCSIKEHANKLKEFVAYLEKQKEPKKEFHIPSYMGMAHYNPVPIEQKEQKPEQYSPLCSTTKDKINEYIANHFITDTVVKTDIKSIVKAMEEGIRLGKESQKTVELDEESKKAVLKAVEFLNKYGNFLCDGSFDKEANAIYKVADSLKLLSTKSKQEWSEKDDEIRNALIAFLEMNTGYFSCNGFTKDDIVQWLKSLYSQPKQEWSEEDEKMRNLAIEWAETMSGQFSFVSMDSTDFRKIATWLKSIRPSWKPTEEQMEVFQNTMQRLLRAGGTGKWYAILESLYEQLKKL